MINLFLAMASGTHVVVLGKIPSPKILGVAFKKVRPTVIISVPLVLEKIYQNNASAHTQEPQGALHALAAHPAQCGLS